MAVRNTDSLNSLGDIALYLDITKRTVLVWEAQHGLPLYRPAGSGKVFACKSELELWKRGQWPPENAKK